jgi:hypothetical protein
MLIEPTPRDMLQQRRMELLDHGVGLNRTRVTDLARATGNVMLAEYALVQTRLTHLGYLLLELAL